jgi:N-formylmethionyl-tRNA deformylase
MKFKYLLLCLAIACLPFRLSARRFKIDGPNGKLYTVIDEPQLAEGQKCPVVILMHGLMSLCDDPVMVSISGEIVRNGYATVRFDFDGHARSGGKFVDMTVSNEVADARFIYDYVRGLDRYTEVSFLGHSQGGLVASLLAGDLGDDAVSKVVLMAPASMLADQAREGYVIKAKFDPFDVPDYVCLNGAHIGRGYILDLQTMDVYKRSSKYEGPVCIIQGTSDETVPYTCCFRYHETYKNSELHLMEGYGHDFLINLSYAADVAVDFLTGRVSTEFARSAMKTSGLSKDEKMLIMDSDSVMRVLTIDDREDSLILRDKSKLFTDRVLGSKYAKTLAAKMIATVTSPKEDGVGIAGPQVGVLRRVVAVQRFDKPGNPFEVYFNIVIEPATDQTACGREGCLSVPKKRGMVDRYTSVKITYTDPNTLQRVTEIVSGYTAVIFQHETDHLDGVLYIDKASSISDI